MDIYRRYSYTYTARRLERGDRTRTAVHFNKRSEKCRAVKRPQAALRAHLLLLLSNPRSMGINEFFSIYGKKYATFSVMTYCKLNDSAFMHTIICIYVHFDHFLLFIINLYCR